MLLKNNLVSPFQIYSWGWCYKWCNTWVFTQVRQHLVYWHVQGAILNKILERIEIISLLRFTTTTYINETQVKEFENLQCSWQKTTINNKRDFVFFVTDHKDRPHKRLNVLTCSIVVDGCLKTNMRRSVGQNESQVLTVLCLDKPKWNG